MEIAQEIGSYAGFAAVLGLAILSALYFSQARDVKRLREWAARGPERAPEPQSVVATPQPAKPTQPATPAGGKPVVGATAGPAAGAQPKPAQAAAAGAATAAAVQGAAAGAAAAGAAGGASTPKGESATPASASAATKTRDAEGAAAGEGGPPTETVQPAAAPNGSGTDTGERPAPGTPEATPPPGPPTSPPSLPARAPVRRPPTPRPGASARPHPTILPSYEEVRDPTPWYRRLLASPRYLVLVVVAVLVVGGAAAFGLTQLGSSGGGSESIPSQRAVSGDGGGSAPSTGQPAAVDPSKITVAVLNGTTVPGLAAQIGDKLQSGRFKLGNVSNSSDGGTRAESVVLFAGGSEREARAVSRRLRIDQREPIDAQTQQLAGDASVVVIAGADQTQ